MNYYLVKFGDHEIKCANKSGAYEVYDCFGRNGVIIEHHLTDTDANGNAKEYVNIFTKATRRKVKDEFKYYLR